MNNQYAILDWDKLNEDDRQSDVSDFKGGLEKQGTEILIWRGVSVVDDTIVGKEEGKWEETIVLEQHTDTTIPEWAKYIIEVKQHNGLVEEKFAETSIGAWTKAKRLAESYD